MIFEPTNVELVYENQYKIFVWHTVEDYDRNPVVTPDYIVWNNKEMIFVEIKRKNEILNLNKLM